jgi:hypothetical protein
MCQDVGIGSYLSKPFLGQKILVSAAITDHDKSKGWA